MRRMTGEVGAFDTLALADPIQRRNKFASGTQPCSYNVDYSTVIEKQSKAKQGKASNGKENVTPRFIITIRNSGNSIRSLSLSLFIDHWEYLLVSFRCGFSPSSRCSPSISPIVSCLRTLRIRTQLPR